MSTPIRHEDIKAGDRIRCTEVTEYIAGDEDAPSPRLVATYELIKRPVTLPTVDGIYFPYPTFRASVRIVKLQRGRWSNADGSYLDESDLDWLKGVHAEGKLTLFRPVAEVAAETYERAARHLEHSDGTRSAHMLRTFAESEAAK